MRATRPALQGSWIGVIMVAPPASASPYLEAPCLARNSLFASARSR